MEDKHIKVLMIEDNPRDARLIREMLSEVRGALFDLKCADQLSTGLERLAAGGVDVLLLDLILPDSQGLNTFAKAYAQAPEIPIVVLTGLDDETLAVKAVREGAQDYLVKGQVDGNLLERSMRYAIERKWAEEALRRSEQKFKDLTETTTDWMWEVDAQGVYTYASPKIKELLGYEVSEVLGKIPFDLMPNEEAEKIGKFFNEKVINKESFYGLENVNRHKEGHLVVVETSGIPIFDERGQLKGYRGIDRDITERKRAEEQINASLREKEVLLREIHHRVKNNLQIISTLLYLQSGYIKDKEAFEMFNESINRIKSMALIHEKLYQFTDLGKIDVAEYIRELAADLSSSYGVKTDGIKLETHVREVLLTINTAIPCGLITNELVSNSLKHAFPDAKKGKIRIDLFLDSDYMFTLIVSDNGVGFPKDLDFRNTETLGLQLVMTLVKQLKGTIELDRSGGTEFKITFAELKYKERK